MNEKAQEQVKVGVVAHDPIFVNSDCGAVAVFGHELISDELLKVMVGMFNMPIFAEQDHGIFMVNFVDEDLKDVDGKSVYSLFYQEPRAVTVSLPNIWNKVNEELDAAIREGMQNVPSVRLMVMYEIVYNLSHELRHGMIFAKEGTFPETDEEMKALCKDADSFATSFCPEVAKLVNWQVPDLENEPYFGPMIQELFLNVSENETDPVILAQKKVLDSGALLIVLKDGEISEQIDTVREFFRNTMNEGEEEWAKEPVNYGDEAITRVRKALPTNDNPAPAPMVVEQPAPAEEAKPAAEVSAAAPRVEAGPEVEEFDPLADVPFETEPGDDEVNQNYSAPTSAPTTAAPAAPTAQAAPQAVASQAAPAAPTAAAPASAPVTEGPGGFPIIDGSGGAQPTAEERTSMTYEQNNVDESQVPTIMNQVYMALYQHIFANCRLMINGQQPFQNPDAVWQTPVDLNRIPGAAQLIVAADITDPNTGKYNSNQPVQGGMLMGNVKKHTRIPGYGLYLNINGQCIRRTVLPQNPNTNGRYAPNARRGEAIMWVINEDVDRNHPHRWLILVENGKLRNVAAERSRR